LFPALVYASTVFNEVCHVGVSLQQKAENWIQLL